MDNSQPDAELSLEQALSALEDIVERLSAPGSDLDEILKLYEEGVKFLGFCKTRLQEAETKITLLNAGLEESNRSEAENG